MAEPRWEEFPLPFYIFGSNTVWMLVGDSMGIYPVPYEAHQMTYQDAADDHVVVDETKE